MNVSGLVVKTVFANVLDGFVYLAQHKATRRHPKWFPGGLIGPGGALQAMQLYCPYYHTSSLKTSLVAVWHHVVQHTQGPGVHRVPGLAGEGPLKDPWPSAGNGEHEVYLLLSEKFSSLLAGSTWQGREWKCCLPKSRAERSSFCFCWGLQETSSDESHCSRERGASLGSCGGCQCIYWPPWACPPPPWLASVALQVVASWPFVRLWVAARPGLMWMESNLSGISAHSVQDQSLAQPDFAVGRAGE